MYGLSISKEIFKMKMCGNLKELVCWKLKGQLIQTLHFFAKFVKFMSFLLLFGKSVPQYVYNIAHSTIFYNISYIAYCNIWFINCKHFCNILSKRFLKYYENCYYFSYCLITPKYRSGGYIFGSKTIHKYSSLYFEIRTQ